MSRWPAAGLANDGRRTPVWVHSKVVIVDGEWATVGSCDLHRYSLFGNCELNAAFWCRDASHALLFELLREHLGRDVSAMDDLSASQLFRAIAAENGRRFRAGEAAWQGLAFSLFP